MESYAYRPTQSNLPKLTDSTWYKTLKIPKTKTKNNSAFDNNYHNLSQINNTSKTIRNLSAKKINSTKLRKKIRSSSVPHDLSSQETDDSLFVLSQIKNMERIISKRVNKGLVWKEKPRNIFEISTSRNYKEIKNIKQKVYDNRFEESKDFDLKHEISKKKYFPIERVQVINEASGIVKKFENEINKNKSMNNFFIKKRVDIHTFTKQNRDICLKNNMIKILKEQKNKIKFNENNYKKALEDANKGYIKDKEAFDKFIINSKLESKKQELKVEEAIRNRKKMAENLYNASMAIRMNQDEIEKRIKNIISFYSYAEFIHRIIGSDSMKNININKLLIKPSKNRAKDINYLVQTTFNLFGFLLEEKNIGDKHNNKNSNNINFDSEQISYLFNSLESIIMKNIDERDKIINEIEKQNNGSDIIFLQKRKRKHEEELQFLKDELDNFKNIYKPVDEDYQTDLKKAENSIKDILHELISQDLCIDTEIILKKNDNLDNNINNNSKNVFDILHDVEKKVNFYMNEIEKIEDDEELFREVVEKVKNENKSIKYKNSKKLLEKLEEEKKIKYFERYNRIQIKSIVEFYPPWAKKKKNVKKKTNIDKYQEDKQLLYYH